MLLRAVSLSTLGFLLGVELIQCRIYPPGQVSLEVFGLLPCTDRLCSPLPLSSRFFEQPLVCDLTISLSLFLPFSSSFVGRDPVGVCFELALITTVFDGACHARNLCTIPRD